MSTLISRGNEPQVLFVRRRDDAHPGMHPKDRTPPFSAILSGEQLFQAGIGYRIIEIAGNTPVADNEKNEVENWDGAVFFEINYPDLSFFQAFFSSMVRMPRNCAAYGLLAISQTGSILESKLDYCVTGEPEAVIPDLAKWLLSGKEGEPPAGVAWIADGAPVDSGPAGAVNTNNMPFIPAEILKTESYHKHSFPLAIGKPLRWGFIIAGRGCRYSCSFCSAVARQSPSREFRLCKPERLVDEMFYQVEEAGRTIISIEDDLFTGDRDWVLEICELLEKRNWKHPWIIQTRVDCLDTELAKRLRSVHCAGITCGVESGSDTILKNIKKGLSASQTKETVSMLHGLGFKLRCTAMIGSPGETENEFKKTQSLLKELNPLIVQLYYFTPYPDTQYFDPLNSDPNVCRLENPSTRFSAFDTDSIAKMRLSFYRKFYMSPRYLLSHAIEWSAYCLFNPSTSLRLIWLFMTFFTGMLFNPTGIKSVEARDRKFKTTL